MSDLHIQALARDIARRVHALAEHDPNAVRVIDRLLARLELGHDRYGALDLAARDWRRERSEELLDAVVYDTAETLRLDDLAHANLQAAAAEELRVERGTCRFAPVTITAEQAALVERNTDLMARLKVDNDRAIARAKDGLDEAIELARWQANDQLTRVSEEPRAIARATELEHDPYLAIEVKP